MSGREGADREPEFDLAPGEALSDCVGFRVESGGAVVGVVDDVRYGPSTRWDHPTALAIRRDGTSRVLVVPADEVVDVVRDERLVVLRDPLAVVSDDALVRGRPLAGVEAHLMRRRRRPRRRG